MKVGKGGFGPLLPRHVDSATVRERVPQQALVGLMRFFILKKCIGTVQTVKSIGTVQTVKIVQLSKYTLDVADADVRSCLGLGLGNHFHLARRRRMPSACYYYIYI